MAHDVQVLSTPARATETSIEQPLVALLQAQGWRISWQLFNKDTKSLLHASGLRPVSRELLAQLEYRVAADSIFFDDAGYIAKGDCVLMYQSQEAWDRQQALDAEINARKEGTGQVEELNDELLEVLARAGVPSGALKSGGLYPGATRVLPVAAHVAVSKQAAG